MRNNLQIFAYALISLSTLFARRSNNILVQLLRYFFVGGVCFVVDFSLMVCLAEYAGLHYLWAATIAFCAGLTLNYCLSIKWVFGRENATRADALRDFLGFAVIGVLGLGLNDLIMWASTSLLALHYALSKVVATIVVFGWNFLARRFITSPATSSSDASQPVSSAL